MRSCQPSFQSAMVSEKGGAISQGPAVDWDWTSFEAQAKTEVSDAIIGVYRQIVDWFERNAAGVKWGRGRSLATFMGRVMVADADVEIVRVFANGGVQINLASLPKECREEFRKHLERVVDFELSPASDHPTGSLTTEWNGTGHLNGRMAEGNLLECYPARLAVLRQTSSLQNRVDWYSVGAFDAGSFTIFASSKSRPTKWRRPLRQLQGWGPPSTRSLMLVLMSVVAAV